MSKRIHTVAIIGSGPSGGTLASLLAMKGVDVTLFDDGRRPDLIVGESLIPAIIPVLRKLGIEDRAAAVCERKPGVSFTFGLGEEIDFCFESVAACSLPTYAYNAPRPAFDRLFDVRAAELGAKRVRRAGEDRAVGCGRAPSRRRIARASALAEGTAAGPARGFHRPQPALCADAGDSGEGRPAEGRRLLRALRWFHARESARAGDHRAARSGMELAHSAAGLSVGRHRGEQGRSRATRRDCRRASRGADRPRPGALRRGTEIAAGSAKLPPTRTTSSSPTAATAPAGR